MGENAGGLLILGGGGFLGAHLVRAGERAGAAVHAPASAELDVTDAAALAAACSALVPRAVVLAAALSRVSDCERHPERAQRSNAVAPGALAERCAATGIRFVHVSTDLVFDGRPPRASGYREDDPTGPLHVYGRTKAAGERAVLAIGGDALVVRLPLLFGDSFGRGLGASDSVCAAVRAGDAPGLFTDEHRTPLDVDEAARALIELALADAGPRGLLHVAGPERVERLTLGRLALTSAGLDPAAVRATTRADAGCADTRPADVSLDASRARALLATELSAPTDALAPSS